MPHEQEQSAEEFARRLAGLTPSSTLARDRVLFEAGRQSGRREGRPWRVAASLLMVGFVGLTAFEVSGRRTPSAAAANSDRLISDQPSTAQVAQSPPDFAPEALSMQGSSS